MDARTLYIRTEVRGNRTDAHCQIAREDWQLHEWNEEGANGAIAVSRAMTAAAGMGFEGCPVILNGQPAGRVECAISRARRAKAAPPPGPVDRMGRAPRIRGGAA